MSPRVGFFEDVGIPDAHTRAFLAAAATSHSIILTRTPGFACRMLLEEGYDGKCFHVKGKSCNWGPMAGFVCLDPILSKKGIRGGLDNLREHHKSLTMGYEGRVSTKMQIIISDGRLSWLIQNGYIVPDDPRAPVLTGLIRVEHRDVPQDIGLIIPGIPWLLQRQGQVWALFYDRSRTYNVHPPLQPPLNRSPEGLRRLFQGFQEIFFRAEVPGVPTGEAAVRRVWRQYGDREGHFRDIHRSIGHHGTINHQGVFYEPVLALVNPHPPYANDWHYKNAVTGDYDLFAVWPPIGEHPIKDRRRVRMFPEIQGQQIVRGEDPEVGNISDRVFLVAQLINSEIARGHQGGEIPNRVFHSDEAGRPFVSDCDFPVAAFLPEGPGNRMRLINNARELRQFALDHHRHYRLYINPACVDELGLPRNMFSWD